MVTYNTDKKYNDQFNSFYNSAPRIVIILENGIGIDSLLNLACSLGISEAGLGAESTGIAGSFLLVDFGSGVDAFLLTANVSALDTGQGIESILPITGSMAITETGHGIDITATAKTFFIIDENNVLQPLGVVVLHGKNDLLPGSRDYNEEIPGRHGEIKFGHTFQPRLLELRVAQSTDPATREQLKRTLAKWLNPLAGPQPLVFAEDIEKMYYVKYAGKIDLNQWPNYMEFTIPFKASDPFIVGSFEQTHVGSGTINNKGNIETNFTVEISGPITNPSVTVGSSVLSWTGTVSAGQTLIIDTGKMAVTLNGSSVLGTYTGGFPKLQPGDTAVTAIGQAIIRWRSRWAGC